MRGQKHTHGGLPHSLRLQQDSQHRLVRPPAPPPAACWTESESRTESRRRNSKGAHSIRSGTIANSPWNTPLPSLHNTIRMSNQVTGLVLKLVTTLAHDAVGVFGYWRQLHLFVIRVAHESSRSCAHHHRPQYSRQQNGTKQKNRKLPSTRRLRRKTRYQQCHEPRFPTWLKHFSLITRIAIHASPAKISFGLEDMVMIDLACAMCRAATFLCFDRGLRVREDSRGPGNSLGSGCGSGGAGARGPCGTCLARKW